MRLIPTRWAPTQLRASERLYLKFHLLAPHLQVIIDGRDFNKKQRDKAQEILDHITDELFLLCNVFHIDVLSLLSTYSLQYQVKGKCIIGEYRRQIEFTENLEKLRGGQSHHLQTFLKTAKCTNRASALREHLNSNCKKPLDSCNTLEMYETSKYKAFKCVRYNLYSV